MGLNQSEQTMCFRLLISQQVLVFFVFYRDLRGAATLGKPTISLRSRWFLHHPWLTYFGNVALSSDSWFGLVTSETLNVKRPPRGGPVLLIQIAVRRRILRNCCNIPANNCQTNTNSNTNKLHSHIVCSQSCYTIRYEEDGVGSSGCW